MNIELRMRKIPMALAALGAVLLAPNGLMIARDYDVAADLRGTWRFEIGDNREWARPDLNDRGWESITVPSPWEDQGFPGYDGYAWYRKHFRGSDTWGDRVLYLVFDCIDDVDEVYVNGELIGFSGQFPPDYLTAYNATREYFLPASILNLKGDNVVAVRVYDRELSGGIVRGRVGVFSLRDPLRPEIALAARWKLKSGDDRAWMDPAADDSDWQDVRVPAYWETQGLKGYNGFGWYRTVFRIPAPYRGKKLVIVLGRIDDADEVYLNGELIGRTGSMPHYSGEYMPSDAYLKVRAYTLPPDGVVWDGENTIAVRVYDGFMHGGIYDGPVGIVTRDSYMAWERRQGARDEPLSRFLDWLFD